MLTLLLPTKTTVVVAAGLYVVLTTLLTLCDVTLVLTPISPPAEKVVLMLTELLPDWADSVFL
jgi:hypothetical protein